MSGIGETLKHKIGPLPVWAWGGAGAVIIFLMSHKAPTGTPNQPESQATAGGSASPFMNQSAPNAVGLDTQSTSLLQGLGNQVSQAMQSQQQTMQYIEQQAANTQYNQWYQTQAGLSVSQNNPSLAPGAFAPPYPQIWDAATGIWNGFDARASQWTNGVQNWTVPGWPGVQKAPQAAPFVPNLGWYNGYPTGGSSPWSIVY